MKLLPVVTVALLALFLVASYQDLAVAAAADGGPAEGVPDGKGGDRIWPQEGRCVKKCQECCGNCQGCRCGCARNMKAGSNFMTGSSP